jgi:chitin disaccharide deacetylase
MRELILNADDFGLTRGINSGIIRAHRDGILTSATLMAMGPAFDDAVEQAHANPTLGVGCHLVLTGGLAAASAEEIPSLVDKNGRLPESLSALVANVTTGSVPTSEIEAEFRAQIGKIRRAGIEPSHLDTHKHTHVHPRVMNALGRVAREFGITRVRNPVENLRDSWRSNRSDGTNTVRNLAAAATVSAVASGFRAISSKYSLRFPDHFLGLAVTGQLGAGALCRLINALDEGQTEIMLHPGIWDEDLARTGSRLQRQRETEMKGLLASEVKRAVAERGIRLISYRDLN